MKTPNFIPAQAGPQPSAILNLIENTAANAGMGFNTVATFAAVSEPRAAARPNSPQPQPVLTPDQIQLVRLSIKGPKAKSGAPSQAVVRTFNLNAEIVQGKLRIFGLRRENSPVQFKLFELLNDAGYIAIKTDGKDFHWYLLDRNFNFAMAAVQAPISSPPSLLQKPEAERLYVIDFIEFGALIDEYNPESMALAMSSN